MQRLKKRVVAVYYILGLIVVLVISARLTSGSTVAGSASPVAELAGPKAEKQASQDDRVIIAVEPQTSIVSLGQKFRVQVMTRAGDYQLDGLQVYLDFVPRYLQVTEIMAGPVWNPNFIFERTFNNEHGQINFAAGLTWGVDPLTGEFEVMTIELEAVEATPGTSLTFSLERPRKTGIVFEGNPLPLEVQNGYVVAGMPPETPTLEPTVTPTSTPSHTWVHLPLILRH